MKKLMFWIGLLLTIGIAGNETSPMWVVATIGLLGVAMMLVTVKSVVACFK